MHAWMYVFQSMINEWFHELGIYRGGHTNARRIIRYEIAREFDFNFFMCGKRPIGSLLLARALLTGRNEGNGPILRFREHLKITFERSGKSHGSQIFSMIQLFEIAGFSGTHYCMLFKFIHLEYIPFKHVYRFSKFQ